MSTAVNVRRTWEDPDAKTATKIGELIRVAIVDEIIRRDREDEPVSITRAPRDIASERAANIVVAGSLRNEIDGDAIWIATMEAILRMTKPEYGSAPLPQHVTSLVDEIVSVLMGRG